MLAAGGCVISQHITGKPIKFLGMGEKLMALEPFIRNVLPVVILEWAMFFFLELKLRTLNRKSRIKTEAQQLALKNEEVKVRPARLKNS